MLGNKKGPVKTEPKRNTARAVLLAVYFSVAENIVYFCAAFQSIYTCAIMRFIYRRFICERSDGRVICEVVYNCVFANFIDKARTCDCKYLRISAHCIAFGICYNSPKLIARLVSLPVMRWGRKRESAKEVPTDFLILHFPIFSELKK